MVVMAMRVFSRTPLCVHHQKFASTTTTASSSFFPFRGLVAAAGAPPPNCSSSSSSSSQKSGVHSLKNTSLSAGAVTTEEEEEEEEVEKELGTLLRRRRTETITGEPPSCPVPNFAPGANEVTLLDPLNLLPKALQQQQKKAATHNDDNDRPLLLYVPGMDCTGKGIASQLPTLAAAGYDIRCVYIPSDNRSTWQELVQMVCHLLQKEVEEDEEGTETTQKQQQPRQYRRHLTVVGESFGACLALRLALASPSLITHLVLINPATNFAQNNPLVSFCASTGLLAFFPQTLYQIAQDLMLPLMVKRNRVSIKDHETLLSPVDFVPAECGAWRFSMLNDSTGLSDVDIQSINMPTLLFASAKDWVLPSMAECARLQCLLPNAKRVILPESGHTALLEASIDLAKMLETHGFVVPPEPTSTLLHLSSLASSPSTTTPQPDAPLFKRQHAILDNRLDELGRLLEPWRILTSPLVSGAETLPDAAAEPRRPILFVGNHTLFGVYDSPILVYELFLRGFHARGLAHPAHWSSGVGPVFERYGNVKSSKFAAYRLLKEGESVLLFPGGAREVCKRKGEEYKLLWKPTVDFVRMASSHKAIIVPFALLGADEAYKILLDGDDILASPLGPLVQAVYDQLKLSTDSIYPLTGLPVLGLPSLIPVPSIERIYIHFADPIDTANYNCSLRNQQECKDLYLLVKQKVEDSISLLKQTREKDPERSLPVRLFAKTMSLLPGNIFSSSSW
ncbi:unnamed protein product [Sphagnum troendelagicum]|uniref:Phospholipid/glycerol acyltransferase domain-containing protein n=1 Tax=Sphagnum troendelagicum TaxID=128251 RepID=A0ABP0USY0_9BRYO